MPMTKAAAVAAAAVGRGKERPVGRDDRAFWEKRTRRNLFSPARLTGYLRCLWPGAVAHATGAMERPLLRLVSGPSSDERRRTLPPPPPLDRPFVRSLSHSSLEI
jgi:hypothetical protein